MVLNDTALLKKLQIEAAQTNDNILSDAERSRGIYILSELKNLVSSMNCQVQGVYNSGANTLAPTRGMFGMSWTMNQLKDAVGALHLALAPHKLLPFEVLSEILLHCHRENLVVFPANVSKPPWILGMVCSRWRNVIWSDRRIWRCISVDVAACGFKSIQIAEHVILGRGTLSLMVRDETDSEEDSLRAFEALVSPFLPRLQKLYLSIPYSIFVRLLEIPPNKFSSVASFQLTINSCGGFSPNHLILRRDGTLFDNAQHLRKLEISTTQLPTLSVILRLKIPWRQLTVLDLGDNITPVLPNAIYRILGESFALEHLTLHVAKAEWPRGYDGDRHLPHLRSLTLHIDNPGIFRHLFIPSLADLRISGKVKFPNPELTSMVRRSSCTILTLEYDGESTSYKDIDLHDFLEYVSSLRSLSTFFLVIKRQTLKKITEGELLPLLESLQIRVDSPTAFVDLIASKPPKSKGSGFRDARGYFARVLGQKPVSMEAALERLRRINVEWGTSYILADD